MPISTNSAADQRPVPLRWATDYRSLYLDGSSSSQTDYRLAAWFDEGSNTLRRLVSPTYYTSDEPSYSGKSILGINMIRIPEMYYIMAEALLESDPDTATDYFDDVIKTRGLDALGDQGRTVTADASTSSAARSSTARDSNGST